MSVQIVTGYTGERHITPYMDAEINRGLLASADLASREGSCILPTGGRMEASMPDINTFVIADGAFAIQGHIGITNGEQLTIDTCASGMNRIDLVVARFEHNNNTNIDSMSIVVLKGTETSSSNPTTPIHREGVIAEGADADLVLYQLTLSGSTVAFARRVSIFNGGVMNVNNSDIDIKKADNNIKSVQYPGISVQDKNGLTIGRFENVTYADGQNGVQFYARQYDGETYRGQKYMRVMIQKNGNTAWSCDPPMFRVKKVSFVCTVNGNSQGYINAWSYATKNVPYGYSLAGFVGFSTNNSHVVMVSCRPSNSQYSFEVTNLASSKQTCTFEVWALYVQSGMIAFN